MKMHVEPAPPSIKSAEWIRKCAYCLLYSAWALMFIAVLFAILIPNLGIVLSITGALCSFISLIVMEIYNNKTKSIREQRRLLGHSPWE